MLLYLQDLKDITYSRLQNAKSLLGRDNQEINPFKEGSYMPRGKAQTYRKKHSLGE